MEFRYKYKIRVSDLWQAQMYYTYSSYVAVINVICILSAVALLVALWGTAPGWMKACLLLFLSLFTVIQPLGAYRRAKASLQGNENELELLFNDNGIQITMDGRHETKGWNQVRAVVIKPTIIVVYMSGSQGYIIANRVLKDTRKDFVKFIKSIKVLKPSNN